MRFVLSNRSFVSLVVAVAVGLWCYYAYPFPYRDPLLAHIGRYRPLVYAEFFWIYTLLLFTTPFLACLASVSFLYRLAPSFVPAVRHGKCPPYPPPEERPDLYLVLGEKHHQKDPQPAERPEWVCLWRDRLYTGILCVGGTGSGKTASAMYPYAKQILSWRAHDKLRKAAALVLEVKGDFCHKIKHILGECGRQDDYVELSLDSGFRYNPLHSDLEPHALAYAIIAASQNDTGKSKDPFWDKADIDTADSLIRLHRLLNDYVTLDDLYTSVVNPGLLARQIETIRERYADQEIGVTKQDLVRADKDLATMFRWKVDKARGIWRAPHSTLLRQTLADAGVDYIVIDKSDHEVDTVVRLQVDAVESWYAKWTAPDNDKLKNSIVFGLSTLLGPFNKSAEINHTFCPPKIAFDPIRNASEKHGKPFPKFSELMESGKVVALNLPVAKDVGIARLIGTILKMDFQRSLLQRIPKMKGNTDRFRDVLMMVDEYQVFATCGGSNPTGDDAFYNLSRQAKVIPIVATQSYSSLKSGIAADNDAWKTLLQAFQTIIAMRTMDDLTAKMISEMIGKEDRYMPSYSMSESGQDAKASLLTARTITRKASISLNKSYSVQLRDMFPSWVFSKLRDFEAIVVGHDGSEPLITRLYLKPYFRSPNQTWFEQRGIA